MDSVYFNFLDKEEWVDNSSSLKLEGHFAPEALRPHFAYHPEHSIAAQNISYTVIFRSYLILRRST